MVLKKEDLIGIELEFTLFDREDQSLQNIAKQLYFDSLDDMLIQKFGNGWLQKEASDCHIEITTLPFNSLYSLHQNLLERVHTLEALTQKYNVAPGTFSEFGVGKSNLMTPNPFGNIPFRSSAYTRLFGFDGTEGLSKLSGFHLNLSQKDDALTQYKTLLALDPAFVFTSTSPISPTLTNGVNCSRMDYMRNIFEMDEYRRDLLGANIEDYPNSLKELENRSIQKYEQWKDLAIERGFSQELFDQLFVPENSGYFPIRVRTDPARMEIRIFDSAPIDVILGVCALYKGYQDRIFNGPEQLPVEIGKKEGEFYFGDKKVILPEIKTLRGLSENAIAYGLKDDAVYSYLSQVVSFSKEGLSNEEQQYLKPIEKMISSRENYANLLTSYLGSPMEGLRYSVDQGREATIFMRKLYEDSLF